MEGISRCIGEVHPVYETVHSSVLSEEWPTRKCAESSPLLDYFRLGDDSGTSTFEGYTPRIFAGVVIVSRPA